MKKLTNDPPIVIPKIEREEAIEFQDSIIEVSDGLLIARGDAYTPSYPGAAYLLQLLKERPATALMADKENVVAFMKQRQSRIWT